MITLVAIEWQWYDLTRYAIEHSLKNIDVKEVVIISDKEILPGAKHIHMNPVNGYTEYNRVMLKQVAEHINTDHALYVQWDGIANRRDLWQPEFLNYDYIGAPWPWKPEGENIGNGGFSLRSRRLLDACAEDNSINLTEQINTEDSVISSQRKYLESKYNIKFAPTDLAKQFSYELGNMRDTFGFHGLWNVFAYMSDADMDYYVQHINWENWNVYKWHHVMRAIIDKGRKDLYTHALEQLIQHSPELLQPVAAWLEREGNNEQRVII